MFVRWWKNKIIKCYRYLVVVGGGVLVWYRYGCIVKGILRGFLRIWVWVLLLISC